MKKAKKKVILKILIIFSSLLFCLFTSGFIFFFKTTYNVSLDESKLEKEEFVSNLKIYDSENRDIDVNDYFNSGKYVEIEDLPEYTKRAFIETEDKRFYKHNGVDYYRMVGAMVNNLKKGSFSQGASTITQQLIKNTHLSQEKTLVRKMKEIRLAKMLERKYSKNEILEMYLNNIYFGNGCYGIKQASNYYFDKSASELSIGESALLVSVINAPSYYDPVSKNERVENRKKLILKIMKNSSIISDEEYQKSAKTKEIIVNNAKKHTKTSIKHILNEASQCLGVSVNKLKKMNIRIKTKLNNHIQTGLENIIDCGDFLPKNSLGEKPNVGVMVLENSTKKIIAFASSGVDVFKTKRQPGSTIKPILVYAPALECGLIYPESVIKDEKININGYSPSNADKGFHGNVSIRESIEKSLNVPAVKVLSKVGVERAKKFAVKNGISFHKNDKNLALALGGMTNGVTIKELADAYSTFATDGEYKESKIICCIEDVKGNVLYKDDVGFVSVVSKETANLITDMLKGVAQKGTARRLNSLHYDVAAKTGTVGVVSSNKNTDAFNVAYTSEHTIVSWLGAKNEKEYMESSVNGSTYPTLLSKRILNLIYNDCNPKCFEYSDNVVFEYIDTESLGNGVVELSSNGANPSDKKLAIFNKKYLPDYSKKIEIKTAVLKVLMNENQKPTLMFDSEDGYEYNLYRRDYSSGKIIEVCDSFNGEKTQKFKDESVKSGRIYEYWLKIRRKNIDDFKISNSIKLMSY